MKKEYDVGFRKNVLKIPWCKEWLICKCAYGFNVIVKCISQMILSCNYNHALGLSYVMPYNDDEKNRIVALKLYLSS